MDYTDGPYWWSILMGHADGPNWWAILMGHTDGPYWWAILMDHTDGPYWWVILMGHTDGPYWCVVLMAYADGPYWSDMRKVKKCWYIISAVWKKFREHCSSARAFSHVWDTSSFTLSGQQRYQMLICTPIISTNVGSKWPKPCIITLVWGGK